jgi:hypothetical protein
MRLGQVAPVIDIQKTTGRPCYLIYDFDFDSSRLKPGHIEQINSLAKQIVDSRSTQHPIRTVYVKGHTDPVGTPDYNQALGMRRALAVRKELMKALDRIQRHISARVLILASSRGEKDAKYSDATKNRRVEVCLSAKQLKPKPKPKVLSSSCDREDLLKRIDKCHRFNIPHTGFCAATHTIAFSKCNAERRDPFNPGPVLSPEERRACEAEAERQYELCLKQARNIFDDCRRDALRDSNCTEKNFP